MIGGVHTQRYDKRSYDARVTTNYVAERFSRSRHQGRVIGHAELLGWLHAQRDAGELANTDIQKLLKLPSSRVTEIFGGGRQIKLDEAKAIVEHYELDEMRSPVVVPAKIPSEALGIVLEELLRRAGSPRIRESELRPLSEGLARSLELLTANPAIHANPDALKAVAQAIASRLPEATPEA